MFIILSIHSNNANSLTNFLKILYKLNKKNFFKLQFYIQQSPKKKNFLFFLFYNLLMSTKNLKNNLNVLFIANN